MALIGQTLHETSCVPISGEHSAQFVRGIPPSLPQLGTMRPLTHAKLNPLHFSLPIFKRSLESIDPSAGPSFPSFQSLTRLLHPSSDGSSLLFKRLPIPSA